MRKVKYLVITAILGLAACFSASAASVAIQIVTHDFGESKIIDSAYVMEENLFDFFFNRGIIISNTPIVGTEGKKEDDAKHFRQALGFAREGGVDYFVELTADFDIIDAGVKKVFCKVINVSKDTDVASKTFVPSKKIKSEEKDLIAFSNNIAEFIYSSIKKDM